MISRFLATLWILALLTNEARCFNLDITSPVIKQVLNRNVDNYFGYSVAQHSMSDGNNYILVGAPKDTYKSYNQSGAVYKCPFNLDEDLNDCEQITVDFESQIGDQSNKKNYDRVIKEQFKGAKLDGQWFGVSLSSTGNGQFSVSF